MSLTKIDYTRDFGINDEGSLTIEYQAAGAHTRDGKMLPAAIWSKVQASTQSLKINRKGCGAKDNILFFCVS